MRTRVVMGDSFLSHYLNEKEERSLEEFDDEEEIEEE